MVCLSKRALRAALAAGAAVGILLSSSGCLRLDMELEVRSDDSVGGSFTAAWSEDFLEEVASGDNPIEQSELDAFLDALLEGVPDGQRTAYHEDGYLGQTATFTDRPLSDFAEFGGDEWGFLSITHHQRRYSLEGHWDLRTAGFLEEEDLQAAELLVSVNFPARVTDHNGELDGRTVIWRMSPGEEYDLRAEAIERNGWLWFLAGVVSLAVVLALLGLWQWTRIKRYSIGGGRTFALAEAQSVAARCTVRIVGS